MKSAMLLSLGAAMVAAGARLPKEMEEYDPAPPKTSAGKVRPRGCLSAACRGLEKCLCHCKRCKRECKGNP